MDGPIEISPGVFGLGTRMVNWYLVEDTGRLTVVDAGVPAFANTIDADLGKLGFDLDDVAALVLTHSDADHIGIASFLQDAGARILIHADDKSTLRKPGIKGGDATPLNNLRYVWRPSFWHLMIHLGRRGGARPRGVDGAETFVDGTVLDVPGSPRVVHTPGHNPGHCALHFERHRALFVGDAMCTWNPATGSRGAQLMPWAFNFDNVQALASLAALESLEAEVLLPGHGDPWREGPAAAVAAARARAG